MLLWVSTGYTATSVNAVTFLLGAITLAATVELGKRVFRRDLYLNGRTPLEGWMQEYSTIGAGLETVRALRSGLRLRFSMVLLYLLISVEMGILALIAPIGVQTSVQRSVRANYRRIGTGLCLSTKIVPRDAGHWTTKALDVIAKYAKAGGDMEILFNSVGEDEESIPMFSKKALVPGRFMNETIRAGELYLTISIDEHGFRDYEWNTELLFGEGAVVYGNEEKYIRPMFEGIRPFILQGPIVVTLYDGAVAKGDVQRTAFCYGEEIVIPENDTKRVFNFPCDTHGIVLESPLEKMVIRVDPDTIWRFMNQMRLNPNKQNLKLVALAGIRIRLLTLVFNEREKCGADELRYIVPTRLEPVTLGSIVAMLLTTCFVLVALAYYIVLTRNSVDWNSNTYRLINLITRRQEKLGADCTELGGRSGQFAMVINTNGTDHKAHLTIGEAQAAEDFGLARRKPRWLVTDSSGYMQN